MAIAITMKKYLSDYHVDYDVLDHEKTMTASHSAQSSHISGDCVAKGVVLHCGDKWLLAVLPASHRLELGEIKRWAHRPLRLAKEEEITSLFPDCEVGAVPALGEPYGVETVIDDSLEAQPEIYIEGGDHRSLIHLSGDQFRRLTMNSPHGRFSVHA
jgi:Ala-tRNA(Pro) deacylase